MTGKNFYLLDCTLRDGGYVNNWEFDFPRARRLISELYLSGADIIECGIMGKVPNTGKTAVFNALTEMSPILEDKKPDCIYTVMLNYTDNKAVPICRRNEKTVDGIRLAFFKREAEEAVIYANELKEKGFLVFLQAMATYMYSDSEIKMLLESINKLNPFSLSLVDSFGTLYNDDVVKMYNSIDKELSADIVFGFHAHNNMQMALSNTICFIELSKARKIAADATIYGMGRGAGNAATELLMHYMNRKHGKKYDAFRIIRLYEQELLPIYQKLYWGYQARYFITAQHDVNPAYGWYFGNKGIVAMDDFNAAFEAIPLNDRYTLRTDIADKIIKELNINRE